MRNKNVMKPKITIVLLLFCLLFLCVFYFAAKPLIDNKYNDKVIKLLSRFIQTNIGRNLAEHYIEQMSFLKSGMIKGYYELDPQDEGKVSFQLARLIGTGFAVAVVVVINLVLIIIYCVGGKASLPPQKYILFILLLIVLNGTVIRFIMAFAYYGNSDMLAYERVIRIMTAGNNVYALTGRYNYSPVWFMILSFLKYVQMCLPAVSYHFIVKSFLCMVDLATLVFLLLIAEHKAISLPKTAMLFYLNPVSFLITGYHGQFENLTVLMIVIGLFAYLKLNQKPVWGITLLWFFAAAGMIIKHNVFYELIICLNRAIKRYWIKFLLFAGAVCLFLALFIPYWSTGKEGIINNVFMYSSGGGYGIVSLLRFPQFKYLFITGMFVFPLFLGERDIVRQCLLGFLFFITFTSGIAIQYFVLPVAIGALFPSKGFLFYCLAASMFILGSGKNVFVPGLHLLNWNIIWLSAIYWFFSEWIQSKKTIVVTAQEGLTRGENIRSE